jgi:hypothetical protein
LKKPRPPQRLREGAKMGKKGKKHKKCFFFTPKPIFLVKAGSVAKEIYTQFFPTNYHALQTIYPQKMEHFSSFRSRLFWSLKARNLEEIHIRILGEATTCVK